jgi:hypothetical protein
MDKNENKLVRSVNKTEQKKLKLNVAWCNKRRYLY